MVKNALFVSVLLYVVCLNYANIRKKRRWPFTSDNYVCPLHTHPSPNQYYHLGQYGQRFERTCPSNLVFSEADCGCVFPPNECTGMRESPKGPRFYQQNSNGIWWMMKCAPGTLYNRITCRCDRFSNQRFRFKSDVDDILQGR